VAFAGITNISCLCRQACLRYLHVKTATQSRSATQIILLSKIETEGNDSKEGKQGEMWEVRCGMWEVGCERWDVGSEM